MITTKSAKRKMSAIKAAVVKQAGHATTNEKIVGAAAIGAIVGAAATAIGSAMLHGDAPGKKSHPDKKSTA